MPTYVLPLLIRCGDHFKTSTRATAAQVVRAWENASGGHTIIDEAGMRHYLDCSEVQHQALYDSICAETGERAAAPQFQVHCLVCDLERKGPDLLTYADKCARCGQRHWEVQEVKLPPPFVERVSDAELARLEAMLLPESLPWIQQGCVIGSQAVTDAEQEIICDDETCYPQAVTREHMALIAAAVTSLPALLAEIRARRAQR